jgi:hypothetical protein
VGSTGGDAGNLSETFGVSPLPMSPGRVAWFAGLLGSAADVSRTVKGLSRSAVSKGSRMAVIDQQTLQPAIRFYVRKVRWKTPDSAEIEGGYHCDGFCAAGLTFSLERKDGRGAVVSERMNWIT